MEDQNLEEDDRNALAGLSTAPPPRKAHSYSQQLRSNTGTHHKKNRQMRKHSLDDAKTINIGSGNTYGYFLDHASDDDDGDFYPYSTTTTGGVVGGGGGDHSYIINQRMDGMPVGDGSGSGSGSSQDSGHTQQPMPEFIGAGGGVGIFKVPTRAAVHPGRPPCVELRPHPLRETQVGKYLRTIASTDTELWGGQECGVRVWKLSDAYKAGCGVGGRARRGDEDAAPFSESVNTLPAFCLMVDPGTKLVWSGHKDGKIRSWKMDQPHTADNPFKEGLSWQAHRGPVLSMAMSSYGDLWSGSEGGVIKLWPWESVEKSLSLSPEERHMAALLVERSAVDLRSQVTVNGVCNISSSDVKFMLSDNTRARIWAAGSMSFSLWDARTRELIKVFNIEGQIENRADMPTGQEQAVEDDMNVKFVSKSKKEKSNHSFLQRSRNAIMGAADAVRRVASKGAGAFAEDNKKTEALMMATDGVIWSGCSSGLIIQWDGNGNRSQDFLHHAGAVLSLCSYGSRVWVGYVSGTVLILDLEGNLLASWVAHNGPVVDLAVGNGYIYSMATHGGIRGWSIASPGPIDNILRPELAQKEQMYTTRENIKILIGTWNVSQGRASQEALSAWLGSAVSDVGIVVVGLQEVEMGAGFLAMSAAKETVGLEGSSIGLWWQDAIGKTLDEGSAFERVGSRQLAALLIAIWVRKSLRTHVGDLDVGAVACGLGRAIGNKGGVGLRLRVFDRIMCFVNCHLAAHLEAVNRRNADFDHIFRSMAFSRSSNLLNNAAAGVSTASQTVKAANNTGNTPEDGKPDLADADLVMFTGDFNYRLFGISYDEARDFVSQRSFDWLREKDQLRNEMKAGKVFQGMREALIRFPPTYKFERGKPGLGGYDSGEKKRIPAWCDRVLYRDNRMSPAEECSLECPVVASVVMYEAIMEVVESDHKPVRCKLNLEIAHVDRSVRRQEFGRILESNPNIKPCFDELRNVPEISLSADRIVLQNLETFNLRITNKSAKDKAFFQVACEGQSSIKEDEQPSEYRPRGSYGFPRWLEITPAAGMLRPDQTIEISIHHEEHHGMEELADGIPQSWWSEDTRDKEVILLINVRGSNTLDIGTQKLHVRHHYTPTNNSNTTPAVQHIDSKGSKKYHGNTHQRSLPKHVGGNASDANDDHRGLRGP